MTLTRSRGREPPRSPGGQGSHLALLNLLQGLSRSWRGGAGAGLRGRGGAEEETGRESPGHRGQHARLLQKRAETPPFYKTKRRSGRRARSARHGPRRWVPPVRALRHLWVEMERGLESCRRSESNGLWAPRITAVEELQSRVQETLDLLSPQELSNFRIFLKSVDEEPRVTPWRLELEGKNTKGLARLLVQHYCEPAAASRVLTKVLQQLRRVDLFQRWQDAAAAEDRGELGAAMYPGWGRGLVSRGAAGPGAGRVGRAGVSAGFGRGARGFRARLGGGAPGLTGGAEASGARSGRASWDPVTRRAGGRWSRESPFPSAESE